MISRFMHFLFPMTAVCAVALMYSVSAVSQASIILPPTMQIDEQTLLLETDAAATSSCGAVGTCGAAGSEYTGLPATEEPFDSSVTEVDQLLFAFFAAGKANSSTGYSTSSSSVGGGSSSSWCCAIIEPNAVEDDVLLGRLNLELKLFLPEAPGTGLLRPPRQS